MPDLGRVVVERSFDEATAFADVQRAEQAVAWCLEQHDVHFRRSYLSLDGRSMVCLYDAPDAESIRTTQRKGGLPFARIWAATELPGPSGETETPPGLSTVIVERDLPEGMTLDFVRAMMASPGSCFELHRAVLLTSHLSHDTRRMVCAFSAPDAEAVRRASTVAGHPFTRAWTATLHLP